MGFSPICSETFAFFETTKSFSVARNISVHALAATSSEICTRQRCKTWMVSSILGRFEGTPSWTKRREKNYSYFSKANIGISGCPQKRGLSVSVEISEYILYKWMSYSVFHVYKIALLLWQNFKMVLPVVLKCPIGCGTTLSSVNSCSIGGRRQSGWRCCHLLLLSLVRLVQDRPGRMHREDNTWVMKTIVKR